MGMNLRNWFRGGSLGTTDRVILSKRIGLNMKVRTN